MKCEHCEEEVQDQDVAQDLEGTTCEDCAFVLTVRCGACETRDFSDNMAEDGPDGNPLCEHCSRDLSG